MNGKKQPSKSMFQHIVEHDRIIDAWIDRNLIPGFAQFSNYVNRHWKAILIAAVCVGILGLILSHLGTGGAQ